MGLSIKEYILDEAAVEAISTDLQAYLQKLGADRKDIQRLRLSVEETLLNIMEGCGGGLRISVGIGKQLGQHVLRLRYAGEAFDPTRNEEDDWARNLLSGTGYFPCWNYRKRTNNVSLQLTHKAKRSTLFCILIAAVAAAALGAAGPLFPDSLRTTLDEALLTPVSQGFLGLMSTFAGIMIAFTMCSGILNVGDTMTLGRMGRRTLTRFILISFLVSAAAAAMVVPVLGLDLSGNAGEHDSQLVQISRLIFDILPSNPIDPFRTGNAMQIVVIALLVGVGLLLIGERGGRIHGLIDEGAVLTQRIISFICKLIPLFVFVMLLRQIWSGQAETLLSIWKPILLIVGAQLVIAAVLWLTSSLYLKVPAAALMKKVLPPFLLAFTTASSMSAMPLGMETCTEKLGVKKGTVSFAYPLGTVMYMPASIVYFTVIVCTLAGIYHVEINLSWIITAVFSVTLLVIAMPPIPGAGMLVYTILFTRLGIPAEALVLATAMDVIMDYVDTGFNVLLLTLQVACIGKTLGAMDREVLLK